MLLVDSHCHLNFPDFAEDVDEVVARAREQGVGAMQTICTTIAEFPEVHAIAQRFERVWCSVGIHPHEAGKESVTYDELKALAERDKVIGIGETGLDYYYEHSLRAAQQASFRTHIAVARDIGLPLIVHTRDAEADTIAILREEMETGRFSGLIHCFSGSMELAQAAIEMGLFISISGIITFKKSEALRDIVRDIPLDRLLVETDAPYLAPVPYRGKRNEPAYTQHTAQTIAELKQLPFADVAAATTRNFCQLFRKSGLQSHL